jgi:hypothetical protein
VRDGLLKEGEFTEGNRALERGAGTRLRDATVQVRVKPTVHAARYNPLPSRTYR